MEVCHHDRNISLYSKVLIMTVGFGK